jgi:hypothetical protein
MRLEPRCRAVTPSITIKNRGNEKVLSVKARADPIITGTMDPAKKGARSALMYLFIIENLLRIFKPLDSFENINPRCLNNSCVYVTIRCFQFNIASQISQHKGAESKMNLFSPFSFDKKLHFGVIAF